MNQAIQKTEALCGDSVPNNITQIEGWLKTRKEFIDKVASMAVEGKDFHIIKGSKSLAKGGAEKIATIFHWTAEFQKDSETLEMLGNPKDVLAYICKLKNGESVGEGRGARKLSQDSGDINKAIKMAQKSAYIDAVLRASGLSDIFTQDLEDMNTQGLEDREDMGNGGGQQPRPERTYSGGAKDWSKYPATQSQMYTINKIVAKRGITDITEATGIIVKDKDKLNKQEAVEIIRALLSVKGEVRNSPKIGAMGIPVSNEKSDDYYDTTDAV